MKRWFSASGIQWTVFFALVAVLGSVTSNRYVLTLLIFTMISGIAAVGLNLLVGYAGQISIGQAGFFAIGAYASALLTMRLGMPFWLAAPTATLFGGAVGYLLGFPALRVRGHYLAVVTLAFGQIVYTLIGRLPFLTGGYSGLVGIGRPNIGSFGFNTDRSYLFLTLAVAWLVYVAVSNLVRSSVGRALEAVKSSETGATSVGIHVSRLKTSVFALSGGLTALAGALQAHYVQFLSPDSFSVAMSVNLLAMVLVGGLASIPGSMAGAALMTLLPELLKGYQSWQFVLVSIVIMLIVAFIPSGVVSGLWRLLVHRVNPLNLPPPLARALRRHRKRSPVLEVAATKG